MKWGINSLTLTNETIITNGVEKKVIAQHPLRAYWLNNQIEQDSEEHRLDAIGKGARQVNQRQVGGGKHDEHTPGLESNQFAHFEQAKVHAEWAERHENSWKVDKRGRLNTIDHQKRATCQ